MHSYLVCVMPIINATCQSQPTDSFVGILASSFNDQLILNDCYASASGAQPTPLFTVKPKFPKCSESQENDGALCVLELLSLTDLAAELRSANMLAEVANPDSKLIGELCTTYTARYGECVSHTQTAGARCSFSNPMHAAARLSLSQFCDNGTRADMAANKDCLNVSCVRSLRTSHICLDRLTNTSNQTVRW
jgi:hypothetical protein